MKKITKDRIKWIKYLSIISEDVTFRPSSMSVVKPSEYRKIVNDFLKDLLEEGYVVEELDEIEKEMVK